VKIVVKFALIDELGVFGIRGLNFDSYLKVGLGVDGLEDLSESALINLADNFEIFADFLQHLRHRSN
jgi:hypothetical protein